MGFPCLPLNEPVCPVFAVLSFSGGICTTGGGDSHHAYIPSSESNNRLFNFLPLPKKRSHALELKEYDDGWGGFWDVDHMDSKPFIHMGDERNSMGTGALEKYINKMKDLGAKVANGLSG